MEKQAEYVIQQVSQSTYKPIDCKNCGAWLCAEWTSDGVSYLVFELRHAAIDRAEIVGHAALRCARCGAVTVWNGGSDTHICPQDGPGEAQVGE